MIFAAALILILAGVTTYLVGRGSDARSQEQRVPVRVDRHRPRRPAPWQDDL